MDSDELWAATSPISYRICMEAELHFTLFVSVLIKHYIKSIVLLCSTKKRKTALNKKVIQLIM